MNASQKASSIIDDLQQKVQSLEMMKIVLHIMLSAIFYKRGLLPLVTFGERNLSIPQASNRQGSHVHTYDDFIRGETSQEDGSIFQVKVMERGVDSQTDRVLNLLEGSIFEVLVRRRLQAVKFTIVKKAEPPIEIVEAYTVSFVYHTEHRIGEQGASNQMTSTESLAEKQNIPITAMRSPTDITKGIRQMDRLLIPLTASSTKLPSARTLGVFLLFTDDCPEGYQAPDFVDAADFVFKSANEEDQVVRKLSCGGISTGHHSASLKVTYLNPVSRSCRSSEAQLSPRSVGIGREVADVIPIISLKDSDKRGDGVF